MRIGIFVKIVLILCGLSFFIIPSQGQTQPQNENHKGILVMGVIRYTDETKIREAYTPFIEEIARHFQKQPELKIVDYEELAPLLLNGTVDIGVFTPFTYMDARLYSIRNNTPIQLFATHKSERKPGSRAVIATLKESKINSVNDLKAKKFLFTNSSSATGYRVPLTWFRSNGIEPDHHFFDYDWSGSHDKSIKALCNGEVDGIATYLEALDQEGVDAAKINILWQSDFFVPNNAYVFAPALDKNLADQIRGFMLGVKDNPVLMDKLFSGNPLQIEGWYASDENTFNELRHVLNRKRIRPVISLTFEQHSSIRAEDFGFISLLKRKCYDEIFASGRFAQVDTVWQKETGKNHFNMFLAKVHDDLFDYSIYSNDVLVLNGQLSKDGLNTKLPEILLAGVLQKYPVETQIYFDTHSWIVTWGTEDGINPKIFLFKVHGPDTVVVVHGGQMEIDERSAHFPAHFSSFFQKKSKVTIEYITPENETPTETTQAQGVSFWDNLDNIWGIIGIAVALLTILITSLFQYRNHLRFKKMLFQANNLLVDYLRGSATHEKIIDLKTMFGQLLETSHIKEVQYNILINKVDEIQNLVNSKSPLTDEIKNEIEKIIADGIITEKEYQHLIHLLKMQKYNS